MADIKISELTQAESLSTSDLLESAVPYNGGFLSRRMSLAQLSNYLENYVQHQALTTTAKTIVGAINEVLGDLANYYKKTETYSKTEVDTLIAGVSGLHFEVVQQLPTSDIDMNTIYLVPKQDSGQQDVYDEFICLDNTTTPATWEKIGTTEIDLSDYVTDTELTTILNDYVTTSGLNTILANYATTSAMTTALADKVDKVSGKGLSTEDYTTAEKTKVNGLATVATSGSYNDLTNKPTIPTIPTVATGSVFGALSFDGTDKIVKLSADSQGSGLDLNNFKTAGEYYFDNNHTPLNIPVGNNGILIVLESAGIVKQIWMRQGTKDSNDFHSFVRTCYLSTGNWSIWHPIISGETVSSVEETTTASKAYAVGDYLICRGFLYRVTSAIASGDTITSSGSGANVTKALVGDELTSIKNSIPTVNDGTLTITQNGTSKGTFTANQSGNATIEVKDEKVKQTSLTYLDDNNYRILLSKSATDSEETDGVNKYGNLLFNPYENMLTVPNVEFAYANIHSITTVELITSQYYFQDGHSQVVAMLEANSSSSSINPTMLYLPSANGTLALQSDIPTVATGSTFGTLSFDGVNKSIKLTSDAQSSGKDLNDYKTAGIYNFASANVPTNVPIGTNGVLIVIVFGSGVKQIWMRQGTANSNDHNMYIRMYINSWSKWHQFFLGEMIGGVENSTTASKAYAKNELMNFNGGIYRVTTAISSGGTIASSGSGANVVSTTLSAEIKAIRDALNI